MEQNIDNLFESFTVSFKEQKDFDLMVKIKDAFNCIDISWSERIFNFKDNRERKDFICFALCLGIEEKNLTIGDD